GLAERAAFPFMRHAWITAWWSAFGTGRFGTYAARRDGELAAVLPLVRRGRALFSPTNAHSPAFRPLGDGDALRAIADAALVSGSGSLVVSHLLSDDA